MVGKVRGSINPVTDRDTSTWRLKEAAVVGYTCDDSGEWRK